MFDINYRVNSNNKALFDLIQITVEELIGENKELEPKSDIVQKKAHFTTIEGLEFDREKERCIKCGNPIFGSWTRTDDGYKHTWARDCVNFMPKNVG